LIKRDFVQRKKKTAFYKTKKKKKRKLSKHSPKVSGRSFKGKET